MSSQVTVRLVDDLDGSDATQSLEFTYKGTTYRLDLNDNNASRLEQVLAPYIEAAIRAGSHQAAPGVRVGKRRRATQTEPAPAAIDSPKAVRDWARANGLTVPDRGRLPKSIIEMFRASQV